MHDELSCVGRVLRRHAGVLRPLAAPALADYPDRNIDLIIPYGPGGGFDLYARAVGKVMESHLPKGVKVIPRNIPGAGSTKGIAAMYRAAPDGYTMAIVDLPGAVEPQIVGEQAPYDLDNVTWLGVVNIGVYSLVVGRNAAFPTTGRIPQRRRIASHTSRPPAATTWRWPRSWPVRCSSMPSS